ncbi:Alg9-like mannosyltransferase family-domain-containing protein, partial [Mycotypha africana]|uniref:Alg9-like mannosyltransferase family-domain-containing protein n=1 Tax=Mycotypha africana TaxID=64632 RepID=UPI0023005D00
LFTTLCSWYNIFMSARTLSNTLEMIFTIVALNYWPIPGVISTSGRQWLKNYRIALILAITACIMRPTNGLLWLFLGLQLIIVSPNKTKVITNAILVCSTMLISNIILDTWLYGDNGNNFVFTPYLFFQTNVINNISLFYGAHTWHWYISQGIPFILSTFLPFFALGLYYVYHSKQIYARMKTLLLLSAWILIIYSLLPHKEFRFIYSIIPILLIISACGLQQVSIRTTPRIRRLCMVFILLTQVPMALYLSLWHQRGVMDVMLWLRKRPQETLSLGVLMPCHSTPWYSVIHRNIDMWFLTCEPPLDQTTTYLDEADQFYANPINFIEQHQKDRVWPPTYLILFDALLTNNSELEIYLKQQQGYKECQRFFNSHFHDDPRRRGDVIVFCHE